MSLFIASLNSGSNGNCYYVGNENEAVLIDAGISCRETETRLKRLGLEITKIKAIFISHEHADHINGLCVLVRKHNIPVYITPKTLQKSQLVISSKHVFGFQAYAPIRIGNLTVTAFPKYHDAADPHSFVISDSNVCVGVFTDIGSVCSHVTQNFKSCNAVFLEANYDELMLENGRYPYSLKNRIRGGYGHISNKQAIELVSKHRPARMSHLFLSHLSKDNNCPDLALQQFKAIAGETSVFIASRFNESEVHFISSDEIKKERIITAPVYNFPLSSKTKKIKVGKNEFQLTLF